MRSGVLEIAGRKVGPGQSCFIIAEAGVNHNGDSALAMRLVESAAKAGADAVKFQAFAADALAGPAAPMLGYQRAGASAIRSQQELLRGLELTPADFRALKAHADAVGITFLATPFDAAHLRFLIELGVPAIKIGSGDLTDLPFLELAASTGLPLIVSTGMAYLGEVEAAVRAIRRGWEREPVACRGSAPGLVLLHAVSAYPSEPGESNLRAMRTLGLAFGVPVGFSDHTLGTDIALAGVALGAAVIEKHLTLDRGLPGPDHAASLTPEEYAALVRGIRRVEAALGDGVKRPMPCEQEARRFVRRSLTAARAIAAGEAITPEMLATRRPAEGIEPTAMTCVIGLRPVRPIAAGETLQWECFHMEAESCHGASP